MNFYLDPRRPHIDGGLLRCPDCGQTYDAILDGGTGLPMRHYPQPITTWNNPTPHIAAGLGQWPERICQADGDTLVAHLFRAQIAAAEWDRRTAA
jgi:hypothetical protein